MREFSGRFRARKADLDRRMQLHGAPKLDDNDAGAGAYCTWGR